ncbi:hypothetical protein [Streptomyces sp. NPDC004435]|uniref:hypothetical protein n=1 Tax=Streptomyces sp. NPDC004435 TaxID=3364701 RepID=UPI0036CE7E4E
MQPQEPYPHTPFNAPPVPSTPPPGPVGKRTGVVVLALAAGLALGAGGVGAFWALSGDGASGGGTAAADARAACQALDGFDEKKYTDQGPAGTIALNRYAAAGTLSAAAAAGDASFKELAETIRRSQERHNMTFQFDETVKKDLDRARAICDDL